MISGAQSEVKQISPVQLVPVGPSNAVHQA